MKQTIDKIRDAESKAVTAEQEAKQKAKNIIGDAEKKCSEMIKAAEEKFRKASDDKIILVKAECESELSEIKKKSDTDSEMLISKASKEFDKVFDAVKNVIA